MHVGDPIAGNKEDEIALLIAHQFELLQYVLFNWIQFAHVIRIVEALNLEMNY